MSLIRQITLEDVFPDAFKNSDSQYPLPVDGDSVYVKDIDTINSSSGTFTGNVEDLFSTYQNSTVLEDTSSTSPKTFTVKLNRPQRTNIIGMAASSGNNFSNVKMELLGPSGDIRLTIDFSSDNTKYSSKVFNFIPEAFLSIKFYFYTTDPVSLSDIFITKIQSTNISAIDGYISETNSTTTPLGISGVYTGTAVDTLNYGMVIVSLKSDQASATDGLQIQFSPDGTNWDFEDLFTIAAATGKTFTIQTPARYLRVVYTNGAVAQTYFRLQTTLKPVYVKPSTHRIADSISGQDDAELMKAVITGRAPSGTFVNFESTAGGNFKVSLEELENTISVNSNSQLRTTLFDSSGNELQFDSIHNSAVVADIQHHEIHEGNFYRICNYNATLAASGTIVYSILTGTKYTHIEFYGACGNDATIGFYEGSTITGGTASTIFNKNRNSGNTSVNTATLNPATIPTPGTLLQILFIPGGSGPTASGGQQAERDEWVLLPSTRYNFVLTNNGTTPQPASLALEWYEVS